MRQVTMATRDELVGAVMLFVQVAAVAQAAIAGVRSACCPLWIADKKRRILLSGLAARAGDISVRRLLKLAGRGSDLRSIRTARMPGETPAQTAALASWCFSAPPCR